MWRYLMFVASILLFSLNVHAQTTVVEKHVILTPPPQSASCTTVSAHWEGDVWVDQHTVCKYENRAEGVAWVQEHWTCTTYTADGTCTNWVYTPGQWVKTYP